MTCVTRATLARRCALGPPAPQCQVRRWQRPQSCICNSPLAFHYRREAGLALSMQERCACSTSCEETAKFSPSATPSSRLRPKTSVFTPTTRPRSSMSGPPLLPQLTAAVVCTHCTFKFGPRPPSDRNASRSSPADRMPLTMPCVSENPKPSGQPSAYTVRPSCGNESASMSGAHRDSPEASRRKARSLSGMTPRVLDTRS